MKKKISYWRLIASILICNVAGIIGSLFTTPAIPGWYASLVKPGFNPPNWVFGPVWTTLYILMGVSLYIVWQQGSEKNRTAIAVFMAQLVLNTLWSIIFFGMKAPLPAFIEIVLLWAAILATIVLFHKISGTASFLLLPYLAWVSFAAVLNFALYYLN